MLDINPIKEDVEADRNIRRICESCNTKTSKYLYILKSVLYGIFHLCEKCKEELDCVETNVEEVKTTFVEKKIHTWMELEEPLR
jgi:hypothetical protein